MLSVANFMLCLYLCPAVTYASDNSTSVAAGATGLSYLLYKYRISTPVDPPTLTKLEKPGMGNEVVTLFAHGLGAEGSQAEHYKNVLPGQVYTFNFPDAPEMGSSLAHTGLAQPVEVEHLKNALKQLGDKPEVKKINVFGISRGASSVVNLLKSEGVPHQEKINWLMAESPFATVDDIIVDKLEKMGINWIPGVRWVGHALVKCLYNQYSIANQPIDDLATIPTALKKKPLFILASSEDQLIPAKSSRRLAMAMSKAGFTNLEYHTVPYGQHAGILWGHSAVAYRQKLKSFAQNNKS